MPTPRICPRCNTVNESNVTFCGACATRLVTTTAIVPIAKRPLLPVLNSQQKATLGGVVVGAVAIAVRVGVELLKQSGRPAGTSLERTERRAPRDGNTIVIRRRWMTGEGDGPVRWGEEEIEIDRPTDDNTTYTVKF